MLTSAQILRAAALVNALGRLIRILAPVKLDTSSLAALVWIAMSASSILVATLASARIKLVHILAHV